MLKNSFPLCLVEPNIDAKKLLLTRWWCKWAFHLQNPRLNANWQNWAYGRKKNPNEVAIWLKLTCTGKDLVSGPPENKSTPCSERVWAAKYCQSANYSIKLDINHIWAISFSLFGPTRNRDIWKIYTLPNWLKHTNT